MNRREAVLGTAALASLSSRAWSADKSRSTLATTVHGKVRGTVQDGIHTFKGIRYGADTAPRRFRPALAPEPWKKPLDATQYGAASPQSGKESEPISEDCLFLNVWTPGNRQSSLMGSDSWPL